MKKLLTVILFLLCASAFAASNSNPGLYYGLVPTPAQWNSYFSTKLDYNAGSSSTVPYWDGAGNLVSAPVSGDCTSISNVFTCPLTNSAAALFASPPAIGGTTPASGIFTTITTSQTLGIIGTNTNNNVNPGSVGEFNEAYCPNVTSTATVAFTLATPTVGTWAGASWGVQNGSNPVTSIICPMNITATAPTGLSTATNYWVVPINSTTFHIASTAANAAAGTFLSATGSTTTTTVNSSLIETTTTVMAFSGLILTAGDWDCNGSTVYSPAASTSVTNLQQGVGTSSTAMSVLGSYSDLETAANVMTATSSPVMVTPVARQLLSATTPVYGVSAAIFTVSTMNMTGDLRCRRTR